MYERYDVTNTIIEYSRYKIMEVPSSRADLNLSGAAQRAGKFFTLLPTGNKATNQIWNLKKKHIDSSRL